jgi:hypothetical protein
MMWIDIGVIVLLTFRISLLDRHFRNYLIRINDARSPEGKDE